jgi:hypothetical protein
MTFLGKLLVFLNVFVAFTLLSWAIVLYSNRIDWTQAVYEDQKLTEKVASLQQAIGRAQGLYTTARAPMPVAEQNLARNQVTYARRLGEANNGQFVNIFPDGKTLDLNSQVPIPAITKGPDGQDRNLPGVNVLQEELVAAVKLAGEQYEVIKTARTERDTYGTETLTFNRKAQRLKEIFAETGAEKIYLSENLVNWDEQYATLAKRNSQLAKRLKKLQPNAELPSDAVRGALTLPTVRNP